MEPLDYKETAEAVLRAMPSVLGAFVQPDAFGRPREVHLLIEPGPRPREFAEQVRAALESKLRVPIDQRIISIAQVARPREVSPAEPPPEARTTHRDRVLLQGVRSGITRGRARVIVQLKRGDDVFEGEGVEIAAQDGSARAAARATVDAVNALAGNHARFGLDYATAIDAFGRKYVLVSATVTSQRLGRTSVPVVGAQVMEGDIESAAALATLKAVNRLLQFALGLPDLSGRPARGAR